MAKGGQMVPYWCAACDDAGCTECEEPKPAPPEVPAPDEVWLLTHDDGRQYEGTRVYLSAASANFQAARMSLKVVRYVRAREGGR